MPPSSNYKHSPDNFVNHQSSSLFLVKKIQEHCATNSSIFDIGCASGRVLSSLLDLGYGNLYGCDINKVSQVMSQHFPSLFEYFKSHENRLIDGIDGDMINLKKMTAQLSIDYYITHGRTFDVLAHYQGTKAYLDVLTHCFETCNKGVVVIQNQWTDYYMGLANNFNIRSAEILIGEHLYCPEATEERKYVQKLSHHKRFNKNFFYGFFFK